MSVKSMKDENPDLHKQIGCISGIFQLFDRHRFLTGQRPRSHRQNTRIPGGTSNHIKEQNTTMQKATAKNVKFAKEKPQFSTESSMTSTSSPSCSSSMSSIEFNRKIQIELPSIIQIKVPENSAMKQLDTPGHQSHDFYDIVKDSMHRNSQALSVKTVAKEGKKGRNRTLKHIDSPRPMQAPKSVNTGVMAANEPFYNLGNYQKTPWDSPRLSYDGRYMQDTFKSATKHKELPRLSLDSREGSIKGPQKVGGSSSTMLKKLQESETPKRASSVVARLMGLDALPDSTQTCETPVSTSSSSTSKNEPSAKSSMSDEYKQHQSSASPRTCNVSTLLHSRRDDDDSITNVRPYSRFLLEPTPWRQPDASQGSQLGSSKGSESSVKAANPSLSVYGEIEKRMAQLEFENSGKDLRALKQILEAMQRYKESLNITRDQASSSQSDKRNNRSLNESSKVQSPRTRQKDQKSVPVEMSNSTQDSKFPIILMKPAKVTRKTNNPVSKEMPIHGKSGLSKISTGIPTNGRLIDKLDKQATKGISPAIGHLKGPFSQPHPSAEKSGKMRILKLMQSSKVPQDINGENTTNSGNMVENGSPRLQKKFGLERRSSPPTSPSSHTSSNRRLHNRQPMELSSPRKKFSTLQERSENFSETSCPRREFKHHVDVISPDFGSKRSLASHADIEDIYVDQSERINSTSMQLNGLNQNNVAKELSKESPMAETIVTAEQPSPVSVLDAAFYREDPPSPVKKKSSISQDLDEALNTDDDSEDSSADLPLSSNTTKNNFSNGIRDRDMKTHNFVQILRQIVCSDEKFINFNDRKNPDYKYISEILLASGLLSGPSASQTFDSSGHLISPKLFLTLEEIKDKGHSDTDHSAKKIARTNNPEQMHRKLIFDIVNDILVQKLILESSSTLWCLPNKLAPRKLKRQQLLDELCTEIDQLQHKNKNVGLANEDENLTSLIWEDLTDTDCYTVIPNIVLDIERLIFKDLITEVVRGEVANYPGRHCRQLVFPR